MTGHGETVEYDPEFEVYRIRRGDGVLVGTEYGGYPLGWDERVRAEETLELRAERARYLEWLRWARARGIA